MPTNYYNLLSLDRDASLETIKQTLERLSTGWNSRASLAGDVGDEARNMLDHITKAQEVFTDEESRQHYDKELQQVSPGDDQTQPEIDWQTKSWNYYYAEEYLAAEIAAERARRVNSDDVQVMLLSAEVEMAAASYRTGQMGLRDRFSQAQQYAEQALVMDDKNEYTVSVYEMRGKVLWRMRDMAKASASFDVAMKETDNIHVYAGLAWRKALCHSPEEAADICLNALQTVPDMGKELAAGITDLWCSSVENEAPSTKNWLELANYYATLSKKIARTTIPTAESANAFLAKKLAWAQHGVALTEKRDDLQCQRNSIDQERAAVLTKANNPKIDELSERYGKLFWWPDWGCFLSFLAGWFLTSFYTLFCILLLASIATGYVNGVMALVFLIGIVIPIVYYHIGSGKRHELNRFRQAQQQLRQQADSLAAESQKIAERIAATDTDIAKLSSSQPA